MTGWTPATCRTRTEEEQAAVDRKVAYLSQLEPRSLLAHVQRVLDAEKRDARLCSQLIANVWGIRP